MNAARARLEDEGIPVLVKGEGDGPYRVGPVMLYVPEGVEVQALLILATIGDPLSAEELMQWQADFLADSLAVRRDDSTRFAATEVCCVVPRQNGKGSILEARQLAGLFVLNEPLQIHSAHEFRTASEHHLRISQLIEGCPDLDR